MTNPFNPATEPENYWAWEGTESSASITYTPPSVDVRQVVTQRAGDLSMAIPKWLWDKRIPCGNITLLAGREGIGKSTIAIDIAAQLTRGVLPGKWFGTPKGVVILATEDDISSVILPRLVAAKTDLSRVSFVKVRTEDGHMESLSVPKDLDGLELACKEVDAALVLIDPIMSVIPGNVDTHKDREVRRALDPLAAFAHRTGLAIIGLIHVNKSGTTDPLDSIMASRAFSAVSRSVLYCMTDPECESEDRFLLGHPKSNLGQKQASLRYHLIEVTMEIEEDSEGDSELRTSRVVWDGSDDRSVRELLEAKNQVKRPSGKTANQLVMWITEQDRAVDLAEIEGAFPDMRPGTIRQTLRRMVDRGELIQPGDVRGLYAIPSVTRS